MNSKINDYAMIKHTKITIGEYNVITEYFRQLCQMEGITKNWSILVLDNVQESVLLDSVIKTKLRMCGALPPDRYDEYVEKKKALAAKFVNRDPQGNPIIDEAGEPVITDMVVEYEEMLNLLNQQYPEVANWEPSQYNDGMNETIEVDLIIPKEYGDIPDKMPPAVLAVFQSFYD